jgi:hypothetical protein
LLQALGKKVIIIKDEGHNTKAKIAGELTKLGPDVIPYLEPALKDRKPELREGVALALGKFKPPNGAALPHLLTALKDDNRKVREAAFAGLESFDKAPPEAAVILADRLLRGKEGFERRMAADALHKLAGEDPQTIAALTRAFEDREPEVRLYAALTLPGSSVPPLPALSRMAAEFRRCSARGTTCIATRLPAKREEADRTSGSMEHGSAHRALETQEARQ